MKQFSFNLLLLVSLIMFSCRKTSPSLNSSNLSIPLGTITADVDGISTDFSTNSIADTATEFFDFWYNSFRISVIGYQPNSNNKIEIRLLKVPAQPISAGIYPDLDSLIPTYPYLFYTKNNFLYKNDGYDPYVSKIKIVSIDSTIKGVFSGGVIITEDSTNRQTISHNITNG